MLTESGRNRSRNRKHAADRSTFAGATTLLRIRPLHRASRSNERRPPAGSLVPGGPGGSAARRALWAAADQPLGQDCTLHLVDSEMFRPSTLQLHFKDPDSPNFDNFELYYRKACPPYSSHHRMPKKYDLNLLAPLAVMVLLRLRRDVGDLRESDAKRNQRGNRRGDDSVRYPRRGRSGGEDLRSIDSAVR